MCRCDEPDEFCPGYEDAIFYRTFNFQKSWHVLLLLLFSDASSSNEAVHLQQRLRSLSTELVTLRNRLHVSQPAATVPPPPHATANNNIHSTAPCNQQPIVPPRHSNLPTVPQHINTVGKWNTHLYRPNQSHQNPQQNSKIPGLPDLTYFLIDKMYAIE